MVRTVATSILVANGYNGITWGDWAAWTCSRQQRVSMRITFAQASAVQPGDPGYTAPANPPYWGNAVLRRCVWKTNAPLDHHDMLTMKAGDKFTCDLSIRFPAVDLDHLLPAGHESDAAARRDGDTTGASLVQCGQFRRLQRLVHRSHSGSERGRQLQPR